MDFFGLIIRNGEVDKKKSAPLCSIPKTSGLKEVNSKPGYVLMMEMGFVSWS